MKTAIQELFSQLEIEHPALFNTNTLEGRQFVNDYYKFFKLEKQQIIDAMDVCQRTDFYVKYECSEDYYNKTFKTKQQ